VFLAVNNLHNCKEYEANTITLFTEKFSEVYVGK